MKNINNSEISTLHLTLLLYSNNSKIKYFNDKIPTLNSAFNIWMTTAIVSMVASIQVGKTGNNPISFKDLLNILYNY